MLQAQTVRLVLSGLALSTELVDVSYTVSSTAGAPVVNSISSDGNPVY